MSKELPWVSPKPDCRTNRLTSYAEINALMTEMALPKVRAEIPSGGARSGRENFRLWVQSGGQLLYARNPGPRGQAIIDLLRTVTFGTSTVLTAVPQGLAAAWSSYVVGNAANIYFRDAGWSGRSPRDIVQDILAGAEKQKTSILAPIRDQLKAKFGRQ